jgi:brefeldin A-inhibited guanine nucleotide-exchange protein
LNYLFETLMKYGGEFPPDFWDTLWRQLLFPIFMVLRSKNEMTKMASHEELAVWLSTTMIQALRNMITLFTHFFEALEYMLDRFLDLLILCICQENDTLARIGSNCLQQLILQNVTKFTPEHWGKIVAAFVQLFNRTEATGLFSAATSSSFNKTSSTNGYPTPKAPSSETQSLADLQLGTQTSDQETDASDNALGINGISSPQPSTITDEPLTPTNPRAPTTPGAPPPSNADLEDYSIDSTSQATPAPVTQARRRFFNQIITKCVLSLLMIETVNELFSNDAVYAQIPSAQLLRLMALLKKSYHFAKRFNGDRELRTRLFKEGFMKQPPNLLKQESGAAAVYVSILFRMYHDTSPTRVASREETETALVPLCADIVSSYIDLDEDTQQRNIQTWRPVVVDVLEGFAGFPKEEFEKHVPTFAPLVVGLLNREMGAELQRAVQGLLARIFELRLGIVVPLPSAVADSHEGLTTPASEGGGRGFGSRRTSRAGW